MEADKVIKIPASLDENFFVYWLQFLEPFHNLPPKILLVCAALLKKRYELSQKITDDELVDKILLSKESAKELRETCSVSLQHYHNALCLLRKAKILVDNRVNQRFIPHVTPDSKNFKLLLLFDLDGSKNNKQKE